jgi:hypothetical protein
MFVTSGTATRLIFTRFENHIIEGMQGVFESKEEEEEPKDSKTKKTKLGAISNVPWH